MGVQAGKPAGFGCSCDRFSNVVDTIADAAGADGIVKKAYLSQGFHPIKSSSITKAAKIMKHYHAEPQPKVGASKRGR